MTMKLEKQILLGWGMFVEAAISAAVYCQIPNNKVAREDAYREYLKEKAPHKYIEAVEKNLTWKEAVKQVQDSLRMNSIARTNYAKGQQMVRDSLKRATLTDTVKVVSKPRQFIAPYSANSQ